LHGWIMRRSTSSTSAGGATDAMFTMPRLRHQNSRAPMSVLMKSSHFCAA
jgi:hypothetical protein